MRSISALFYCLLNFWGCFAISAKELFINDDIRAKEVRLLDENGDQLGIKSLDEANEYAYEKGVDLVCIAPQATPPVCRAMDYGKYRFERDKREKEAKKKQQFIRVKDIQLSCRIDKHDFDTRVNQACKFLQGGDKVRAVLRFKGREMAHTDLGREVLERFEDACKEVGASEKKPVLEGRFMSVVLSPVKASTKKSDAN